MRVVRRTRGTVGGEDVVFQGSAAIVLVCQRSHKGELKHEWPGEIQCTARNGRDESIFFSSAPAEGSSHALYRRPSHGRVDGGRLFLRRFIICEERSQLRKTVTSLPFTKERLVVLTQLRLFLVMIVHHAITHAGKYTGRGCVPSGVRLNTAGGRCSSFF